MLGSGVTAPAARGHCSPSVRTERGHPAQPHRTAAPSDPACHPDPGRQPIACHGTHVTGRVSSLCWFMSVAYCKHELAHGDRS